VQAIAYPELTDSHSGAGPSCAQPTNQLQQQQAGQAACQALQPNTTVHGIADDAAIEEYDCTAEGVRNARLKEVQKLQDDLKKIRELKEACALYSQDIKAIGESLTRHQEEEKHREDVALQKAQRILDTFSPASQEHKAVTQALRWHRDFGDDLWSSLTVCLELCESKSSRSTMQVLVLRFLPTFPPHVSTCLSIAQNYMMWCVGASLCNVLLAALFPSAPYDLDSPPMPARITLT
jgi:hypothetical protein